MTSLEFAQNHGVKLKTVKKWFFSGYLPGSRENKETGELEIPEDTLKPYNPRAKEQKSIGRSIVKACSLQRSVFPSMYKISQQRFDQYIEQLIKDGYIEPYKTESGNTQYIDTPLGNDFANGVSETKLKLLQTVTAGVTKGVTAAVLDV